MKDTVFYFSFDLSFHQDTDRVIDKAFVIQGFDYSLVEDEDQDWMDQWGNMEEYGVHDWSTSPRESVNGIGFHSYEVHENMIDEVMEKWRQYFIDKGANASKVVDVKITGRLGDDDIHKLVMDQLVPCTDCE